MLLVGDRINCYSTFVSFDGTSKPDKVLLSPGLLEKFSHLDIPDYESDEESEGTLEMEFRQHKRDYYTTKLEYKDVNK